MDFSLSWAIKPEVFPWLALLLGLCVGSFLNVVVYRLPKMMEREWRAQCAELTGTSSPQSERFNLVAPRSHCPACRHEVRILEIIPVLSWLWQRGRCTACGAAIGVRYPVVEIVAGIASYYAAWRFGITWAALGAAMFCWIMVALAAIDLDTQLLPDDLTMPLLWGGLAFNLSATYTPLGSAVIGAMAGYLVLWSIYWAYRAATGKEGMGYGDFKLLAAIGAWLGWQALPLVILLSSVVGAAVGIALIALRAHHRDRPIPFGPYLAAAGVIAFFWGEQISRRWLPFLG